MDVEDDEDVDGGGAEKAGDRVAFRGWLWKLENRA
jgi:hypothetical protein